MKNKIAETRKALNISQQNLAKAVGISRTALSAIENGTIPKSDNMLKIAKVLNRKAEDIFFQDAVV